MREFVLPLSYPWWISETLVDVFNAYMGTDRHRIRTGRYRIRQQFSESTARHIASAIEKHIATLSDSEGNFNR